MEKECDRIDGNVVKNDPPVIINTRNPKIKTKVDASSNVLCLAPHVYFVVICKALCILQLCGYVSEMCGLYNSCSADTTGEAPAGKP